MSKKSLLFGVIASVITVNSAFAVTSTVTSRDYVDAVVATKQPKIPAAGTNAATPGDTVVTYTSTGDGTIGERRIFDMETDYDWEYNEIVSGHEGDLVTAGDFVGPVMATYELSNHVHPIYNECVEWSGTPRTDENCLLWQLADRTGYPTKTCRTASDCTNMGHPICIKNSNDSSVWDGYCQGQEM